MPVRLLQSFSVVDRGFSFQDLLSLAIRTSELRLRWGKQSLKSWVDSRLGFLSCNSVICTPIIFTGSGATGMQYPSTKFIGCNLCTIVTWWHYWLTKYSLWYFELKLQYSCISYLDSARSGIHICHCIKKGTFQVTKVRRWMMQDNGNYNWSNPI